MTVLPCKPNGGLTFTIFRRQRARALRFDDLRLNRQSKLHRSAHSRKNAVCQLRKGVARGKINKHTATRMCNVIANHAHRKRCWCCDLTEAFWKLNSVPAGFRRLSLNVIDPKRALRRSHRPSTDRLWLKFAVRRPCRSADE